MLCSLRDLRLWQIVTVCVHLLSMFAMTMNDASIKTWLEKRSNGKQVLQVLEKTTCVIYFLASRLLCLVSAGLFLLSGIL